MIWRLTVLCALGALLLATAWRSFENFRHRAPAAPKNFSLGAQEPQSDASKALHLHRQLEPAPTSNLHAEFLNLLAEFEPSDDDPFIREKRAAAFQARLDTIPQPEIALAFDAAESICSENPTQAAVDLRDRVIQRWTELDPLTSPQNTGPTPSLDDLLTTEIISLSDADPVAAAKLAIEKLDQDQQQSNILLGIVQRWAAQDYRSAASWVAQFPEGELRERALTQLDRFTPPSQTIP